MRGELKVVIYWLVVFGLESPGASYKPKSQDQDYKVEFLLRVDPLTFTNLPLGTFVALPPPVI
jgi:hypothetical protein